MRFKQTRNINFYRKGLKKINHQIFTTGLSDRKKITQDRNLDQNRMKRK
jgi:hypothetical protein